MQHKKLKYESYEAEMRLTFLYNIFFKMFHRTITGGF